MPKHQLVAMVMIESDDPRLAPDKLDVSTVEGTTRLRAAVMAALPRNVTRLISVLPPELAEMMCAAHEIAMEAAGAGETIMRPPPGYKAPE